MNTINMEGNRTYTLYISSAMGLPIKLIELDIKLRDGNRLVSDNVVTLKKDLGDLEYQITEEIPLEIVPESISIKYFSPVQEQFLTCNYMLNSLTDYVDSNDIYFSDKSKFYLTIGITSSKSSGLFLGDGKNNILIASVECSNIKVPNAYFETKLNKTAEQFSSELLKRFDIDSDETNLRYIESSLTILNIKKHFSEVVFETKSTLDVKFESAYFFNGEYKTNFTLRDIEKFFIPKNLSFFTKNDNFSNKFVLEFDHLEIFQAYDLLFENENSPSIHFEIINEDEINVYLVSDKKYIELKKVRRF